jgi:hypothetical protein
LSSSTAKRVVLYRFDRQPLEGIVNPAAFLLKEGVEFITLDGMLQSAGYGEFKALCFVTEASRCDLFSFHNLFERRPKVPGLWTRFVFRDGDRLDGILSHNLLDWPEAGFFITPPRAGANRQRVFIPRQALSATELRGVVGISPAGLTATPKAKPSHREDQLSMFET